MNKKFEIANIDALRPVAQELLADNNFNVWAFYGELGAGKTTFIQQVCRALDVIQHVVSPTFNLINEYETCDGTIIYHFDFYRVNDIEEAIHIGTLEYFDSHNLCLLEWPEKIDDLLPEKRRNIYIETIDKSLRTIKVKDHE